MKNILLLQTGGTIAMHFENGGTDLNPEKWSEVLYKEMPELQQIANISIQNVFFEDSSDINQNHWKVLAKQIFDAIEKYDGFVILHGTDTMAYTASALSFALRNLSKPVMLTGSQVPMSNIRSDARRNLVNAVELATCNIPEVAICFNDHLYRGNRSTKMSIGDFDAFTSPNFPELAEIGIQIKLSDKIKQQQDAPPQCIPLFDDALHVIRIHPGLNPQLLDCLDFGNTKAVIIEAFGIGNMPIKGDYSMLPFVEKCRNKGCHVIITSQAAYDSINLDQYKSGQAAKALGALSAGEMTMEATITKTMHLLALDLSEQDFRAMFLQDIAGER
jgi:L-asparaginase